MPLLLAPMTRGQSHSHETIHGIYWRENCCCCCLLSHRKRSPAACTHLTVPKQWPCHSALSKHGHNREFRVLLQDIAKRTQCRLKVCTSMDPSTESLCDGQKCYQGWQAILLSLFIICWQFRDQDSRWPRYASPFFPQLASPFQFP